MKISLLKKAVVSALGVAAYVMAFTWFINNAQGWFGDQQVWVGPFLMLIFFIVSACVTGSLVLARPMMMYLDGQKNDAVYLFVYTVAALAVIIMVTAIFVLIGIRG